MINIDYFARKQLNTLNLWNCSELRYGDSLKSDASSSRFLDKILRSRGITAEDESKFLNPGISQFHDPFLFVDMEKACERIMSAIDNNEKILVYGDYDVDGMTSCAILVLYLKKKGADVEYYIPSRFEDGYGLSIDVFKKLDIDKYSLIISVDCGISSFEETAWLKGRGIDIIVTDHHTYTNPLPDVYALISTTKPDETYPFRNLAGCGVAFKLVQALSIKYNDNREYLKYLEFVTLGTIADLVPLVGENRAIVSVGMKELTNSSNVGVRALISHMIESRGKSSIEVDDISFFCCPRLNAAGRVGDVNTVIKLFFTEDPLEADILVLKLEEFNTLRREIELDVMQKAEQQYYEIYGNKKHSFIVLYGEKWNEGVIGIVASRICEKYNKPCFLISVRDGVGKGSGRSLEGIPVFPMLEQCSDLLITFGGHNLAAGISIEYANIAAFAEKMDKLAADAMKDRLVMKSIKADIISDAGDMSLFNTFELDKLAPFGEGNLRPLFYGDFFRILNASTVGADDAHFRAILARDGSEFKSIAFRQGDKFNRIIGCKFINLLFHMDINSWRGTDDLQLKIVDFKTLQWTRARWAFFREFNKILDRYYTDLDSLNLSVSNVADVRMGGKSFSNDSSLSQAASTLRNKIFSYAHDTSSKTPEDNVISIFVNDLLSLDFAIKVAIKDLGLCVPINLVYGNDVINRAMLDMAPVGENYSRSVPTINIFANCEPEKIAALKEDNMLGNYSYIFGKWYSSQYCDEIRESLEKQAVSVENIGYAQGDVSEYLPNSEEIESAYVKLYDAFDANATEMNISDFADLFTGRRSKRINEFKAIRILNVLETRLGYVFETVNDSDIKIVNKV